MTSSSPDIEISAHAKERIRERIGTTDRKMVQLVLKAWNSKNLNIPKKARAEYNQYRHGQNRLCRELMGYVFIFGIDVGKVVLVTVI